jgi:outer membrane protein OmpA-like peptidoglycan-associated protein
MRTLLTAVALTALIAGCTTKTPEPEVKQPVVMPLAPLVHHILFFDFDKDIPPTNADELLAPHVRHLIQNPLKKVLIEGAADEIGDYDYNVQLGLRRANHIQELFIAGGISPEQLIVRSIGIERPLNQQLNSSSLPRNRRVTLIY